MTFSNPIVGGTTLVRPAIKSPNFITGSAGWSINKDGTAEFNNVLIRGTGTTQAVVVGPSTGPQVIIGSDPTEGFVKFPTNRPIEKLVATLLAGVVNQGAVNESAALIIDGPAVTGAGRRMFFRLNSQPNDGSGVTSMLVGSDDGVTGLVKMTLTDAYFFLTGPRFVVNPDASANAACEIQAVTGHTGNLFLITKNGVDQIHIDAAGKMVHAGDASIGGILSAANRVSGSINITPSAVNTPTQVAITFPSTLKGSTFSCRVSANTSVPQNVFVSYRLLSATGVTLVLTRSDNTTTTTVSYEVEGV